MLEFSSNTKLRTAFQIKPDNFSGYRAVIIDIEGNIQQEHYLGSHEEKIDIKELPEKIYILQIFNMDKQMITYRMFQKSKYHKTYNILGT